MQSKIKYVAKDGREFSDPERLELYEKALAADHNTIGFLVSLLSSLDGFVTGTVICEHDGATCVQPFVTQCLDDWLKDYVDVATLTQGQRYIDSSTQRCAAVLQRKFSPADPCQYILLVGKDVDMKKCEYFYNCNPRLWNILNVKAEIENQKEGKMEMN